MKKSILIHHHCTFESHGETYKTVSFIAHWVNELNKYFDVGLLIHESRNNKVSNDSNIDSNIKIHSLGYEGKKWDRIQRIKRIKNKCKNISKEYDILLIRGITPRQLTVFENCNIENKFFLLVGSLIDSKPKFINIFFNPYSYFFHFVRKNELKKISKFSHIFANSPKIVQELKLYFNIHNSSFVSTNTVSESMISEKVNKPNKNKIQLIFCGRVVKEKGVIELLEAFFFLQKHFKNIELLIVGNVSDKFMSYIKNKKFWKHIQENVKFLGFIKFGVPLFDIFKNSDILILPSYHEGFPHVIWESAVVSLPLIVTDVGGIRGLVSKDDVVFITPYSSIEIVEAVKFIINNEDERLKRTKNIKTKFINYSLEACCLRLYEEIIKDII